MHLEKKAAEAGTRGGSNGGEQIGKARRRNRAPAKAKLELSMAAHSGEGEERTKKMRK